MKKVLIDFPHQVRDAIRLGEEVQIPSLNFDSIIFCGMGGSAISGDLMASLIKKVPVSLSRSYEIPEWVSKKTLAFLFSYSGNTEETFASYRRLKESGTNIICITSGGKLAQEDHFRLIKIPSGFQPRCAIGYLFFPAFILLKKLEIVEGDLNELVGLLDDMSNALSKDTGKGGCLAQKLLGRFPIIYSASPLEAVARRWQAQLNENSKVLAHINFFPEMNHNEIVGFGYPEIDNFVIILRDKDYNPRIEKRIEITKELISPWTEGIEEVWTEGESLLTRIFSLLYLGDWMSFHLAIRRGLDPTPVKRIDYLKERLNEIDTSNSR